MDSNYPQLSRRDFFKGLIALGVIASIPEGKALATLKERSKNIRYLAIWQPPGQRPKLTMFAGDLPADAEVYVVGRQHIVRFPRYNEHDRPSSIQKYKSEMTVGTPEEDEDDAV